MVQLAIRFNKQTIETRKSTANSKRAKQWTENEHTQPEIYCQVADDQLYRKPISSTEVTHSPSTEINN